MSDFNDNQRDTVVSFKPPDVENVEMNTINPNSNTSFIILMNNYRKEIFLILLIIIRIVLTAIEKSIPVVSPVPRSGPFFPKGSNVQDFHDGRLEEALNGISASECSLILYYAPWDAKSQYSVTVIDELATLFKEEINFVAINCWEPESECREKYASKVQVWPVVVFANTYGNSLQYRGPLNKAHLTRFLNTALNPLHRAITSDDIINLMARYDAVVVGCVDLSRHSSGFNTLYNTALKWLEHEPFNEVGFAVVTGQSAIDLGVDHFPTYRIYLWNETLEYPSDKAINSNELFSWISSSLHQVSMWLNLPGSKSSTISPYLNHGPALLLFTPRNSFRETNDAYDMLKQLGLEYYNCNNDLWVKQLSQYIQAQRNVNKELHHTRSNECKEKSYIKKCSMVKGPCENIPVSVTINKWINSSKDPSVNNCLCPKGVKQFCDYATKQSQDIFSADMSPIKIAPLVKESIADLYSAENLLDNKIRKECSLLTQAALYQAAVFLDTPIEEGSPDITGLACQTNRTLSLLAIDSEMYHFVAEGLGLNIMEKSDKTGVVIVDNENEYQNILNESVTPASIKQLIWDHTNKIQNRSFRDNSKHTSFTHNYLQQNNATYSKNEQKDDAHMRTQDKDIGVVTVAEISSNSFKSRVMDCNDTVVVLYYSPYCGFCQHAWHVFLYVRHLFRTIKKISFVRFDMDHNDMPWQLTMDDLPTIIIFPERKSESFTFPDNIDITVPNLLNFVLSNLNGATRLSLILEICGSMYKNTEQRTTCWLELQRETLRLIELSLKQWRNCTDYLKVTLMRRLQLLKAFSLCLLSNPEETSESQMKQMRKIIRKLNLNSREFHLEKMNVMSDGVR